MTGHNLKPHKISFGNLKSNERGVVSSNIIPASLFQFPALSLQKPIISCFFQYSLHIIHRMKTGGTVINKSQKFLIQIFKILPVFRHFICSFLPSLQILFTAFSKLLSPFSPNLYSGDPTCPGFLTSCRPPPVSTFPPVF